MPPARKYLRSRRSAIIPDGNMNMAYDSKYVVSSDPRRVSALCLGSPSISSVFVFKECNVLSNHNKVFSLFNDRKD